VKRYSDQAPFQSTAPKKKKNETTVGGLTREKERKEKPQPREDCGSRGVRESKINGVDKGKGQQTNEKPWLQGGPTVTKRGIAKTRGPYHLFGLVSVVKREENRSGGDYVTTNGNQTGQSKECKRG